MGLELYYTDGCFRALSLVVERCLHTAEVTGSSPVVPTRPPFARAPAIYSRLNIHV